MHSQAKGEGGCGPEHRANDGSHFDRIEAQWDGIVLAALFSGEASVDQHQNPDFKAFCW
jgi:hypothetical protein